MPIKLKINMIVSKETDLQDNGIPNDNNTGQSGQTYLPWQKHK